MLSHWFEERYLYVMEPKSGHEQINKAHQLRSTWFILYHTKKHVQRLYGLVFFCSLHIYLMDDHRAQTGMLTIIIAAYYLDDDTLRPQIPSLGQSGMPPFKA